MKKCRMMGAVVFVLMAATAAWSDEVCNEYFNVGSSPNGVTLGMHISGNNYGQGQSFDLNCGARLTSVAFKVFWGNDLGDIRSLAYGDSVFLSILTVDGVEMARKGYMLDTNIGNRVITHYFTADDVLLPAATYIAAIWTDAPACGGLSSYNVDVVAGSRYETGTPQDFASWGAAGGELYHTIIVDSDVTPVEAPTWGAVKACYR